MIPAWHFYWRSETWPAEVRSSSKAEIQAGGDVPSPILPPSLLTCWLRNLTLHSREAVPFHGKTSYHKWTMRVLPKPHSQHQLTDFSTALLVYFLITTKKKNLFQYYCYSFEGSSPSLCGAAPHSDLPRCPVLTQPKNFSYPQRTCNLCRHRA